MIDSSLIEESARRAAEGDERRRYYRLTRFGRRVAAAEVARLSALIRHAKATGLVPHA
jgi:hypothetical protein